MSEQAKWVRLFRKALPGLIVFAVLLGVVSAALFLKKRSDDKPPAKRPPVNVVTKVIRPEASVLDTFEIVGRVEADRVVKVAAEVDGRVEEVLCLKGKDVRAGQPIVRLNTDILRAEFDCAKAQAEFDAGEYKHITDLHKKGAATTAEENQFRTRAAVSKAALDIARVRLERATIVAPFDGTLDDVAPEVGTYVNVGDIVAVIVDMNPAKIVVDVPEGDVSFLKIGEQGEITVKSQPKKLTGEITYISQLIDRAANTTRVEISIDNHNGLLRNGKIVNVRLLRRELTGAIMVPLNAVIPMDAGRKVVYVVEDGKAVRREVKIELALSSKECICVSSGLKAGDRLIVKGLQFVSPERKVRENRDPASLKLRRGKPGKNQSTSQPINQITG